jgi:hypothetical protein
MTRVFANGDHGSDGVGGLASIWNSRMAVQLGCAVTEPDPDQRRLTLTRTDGTVQQLPYDMLHLVPPFREPDWITTSVMS